MTSTLLKHNSFSFLQSYSVFMVIFLHEMYTGYVMDSSDMISGPKQNKNRKITPLKVTILKNSLRGQDPKTDLTSHKRGITKFCSKEKNLTSVSKI